MTNQLALNTEAFGDPVEVGSSKSKFKKSAEQEKNDPYLLSVIVTGVLITGHYCMCICSRTDVCDESLISLMDIPLMLAADAPSEDGASLSDRTTIATERNSNFSMLQK